MTKLFTSLFFVLCASIASQAQLINPGFESGVNVGWTESSTNFGTPLCDAGCGTCGGNCAPQSGSWYAWFGGSPTQEVGIVSQVFTIPNGTDGSLSFYVKVSTGGASPNDDIVAVLLDGAALFTVTAADTTTYANYTMITVDISAYTDGAVHTLVVGGSEDGGSNILFDTFSLSVDGNVFTGINDVLNHEVDMVVYPNPASNQLTIQFNADMNGEATVRIYDINGRLVSTQLLNDISNKTFNMDVNSYATGMYTVEVINGSNQLRRSVSVIH